LVQSGRFSGKGLGEHVTSVGAVTLEMTSDSRTLSGFFGLIRKPKLPPFQGLFSVARDFALPSDDPEG
jgi:hypothetical protein